MALAGVLETWITERIADRSEFRISDLVDEALDEFDADWQMEFAREEIRSAIYRVVQRAVQRTRRQKPSRVRHGDVVVDIMTLRRRLESADRVWGGWMEYVGDRHVLLPEMTRPDLLGAAAVRRGRGARENHLAALWEELADRLPDDTTHLREVASSIDIEKINNSLRNEDAVAVEEWTDVQQQAIRNSRLIP
jgi:hypothetical protein